MNKKYILVYEEEFCSEYDTHVERFTTGDELHARVNELASNLGDNLVEIKLAGLLHPEFKYEPKETIIKYEPIKVE